MNNFMRVIAGAEPDILYAVLLLMLACALMLLWPDLIAAWDWLRAIWLRLVGRQG